MLYRAVIAVTFFFLVPLAPVQAQWGTLTGRFVYDGDVPSPVPIVVTKDEAVCGAHNLVEENLAVNPENKGISGVVLFLYLARGADAPAAHPTYEANAEAEVRLDNENCRYEPHVVLLRTSQTLVIGNKDPVGHNTKIDPLKNRPINPIIPANSEIKQQFKLEERLPVSVSCSIHPWMNAKLVVRDSPYMAVTDENGQFTIENLPVGEHQFQVWHEASGYVSTVTLDGKKTQWSRGRMTQEIKAGQNDLGDILVPASAFEK